MKKTVIVTGSSRGLGATIVNTLAQQGHNVVINYHNSRQAAQQLVDEIGTHQSIAIQADVTKRNEIDALVEKATQYFGHIDAIVNYACWL